MTAKPAAPQAHTPTPWQHVRTSNGDHVIRTDSEEFGIKADTSLPIAEMWLTKLANADANAEFIVKACNAHDKLVAALREISGIAAEAMLRSPRPFARDIDRLARAALAAVDYD